MQRKFQREWLHTRRDGFFFDKPCEKCGSTVCLELDHINPDEKKSHRIWSWSEERRNEELKKCQILCHWCHKEKSTKENRARYEKK